MRGRLPRSRSQTRARHARRDLERANRACTYPLGSPQARAPHLGSPGNPWPRAHPPGYPGSQRARANLLGSSHSPRAAFLPPHSTKGACRLRSGTIQLQKVCQSASRQPEHSLHPEQSAAAGKHTPVRQEPPHGHAAEPSQKRLIILPSPTQISKAPALAFQTSQALSPLRFAGFLDQMPPSPSTAVAEPDALPASAPPQASAPAGGEQDSMGRAEAKTRPTADRPGDPPLQPRPTDSAVAGNMTGAKSRPDLADQPAAVKQPAAATSGSIKGKVVSSTGAGSTALGSTNRARKSTTAAAPAMPQVPKPLLP